jgi:hypothetical protein
LRGCEGISDVGLLSLRSLKKLETLELTDCPHLSDDAIESLQSALAECEVVR